MPDSLCPDADTVERRTHISNEESNVVLGQYVPRKPLDTQYIVGLVLKQKKHVLLAAASLLVCVGANLASPVLSGMLFETLVMQRPFEAYGRLLGVLLALYVIEPLLTQVYIREACTIGENVQLTLRSEAFRVLLMQGMPFFDRHRASELTKLMSQDLESLRQFVFSNVSRDRGLRAFCEACGSVMVLAWLSWKLGPILASVIVTTAFIAWLYRKQSRSFEKASAHAQQEIAACINQTVANVRTVRIYAGEALERERLGHFSNIAFEAGMGFAKAKAMLESLNRGAIHVSLLSLYGYGGWLVNTGRMPVSTLLAAIGFTFSLVFATQGLLQTWADARAAASAIRRVQNVMSELPVDHTMAAALPPGAWWDMANLSQGSTKMVSSRSIVEHIPNGNGIQNTAAELAMRHDIIFDNVQFSYPQRPGVTVIKNFSAHFPCGKITAIVGRSGAGKSTIAALIERLYSPSDGKITLGDAKISEFSRQQWVDAVAAVTQEPVLFSGTIFDNISYGKPHATMEEVVAAARASHAHDFISELPEGYDSYVGETGGLLSGGQRQRVALARALLKDAKIIILDEPTSSLDAESEGLVQQAIDQLMKDRTVIVIAHRLSTVQAADQILVMENGEIIESGTHRQLLACGGQYKRFVSSQALTLYTSQ